ncbi:MAG TPA: hypothetical protein VGK94_06720 [Candidatus Polarisedimenticolia bacterium]|jgi:hypothetical protein
MRPARGVIRILGAVAPAALAAALSGAGASAGAETALDKYQALLQEKRALLRENGLLQREAALAATREPYIFFHLEESQLEFRVRGKALKSYKFKAMTFDERGRRRADPEAIWKTLDKPLTVLEIEGSRPELIPPDPNSSGETGQLFSDPNQLASQTGAPSTPTHTDAGVLGVDVPTEYYIRFAMGDSGGGHVIINIRTPKTLTFRQKAADRFAEMVENISANLSSWWSGADPDPEHRPRLELFLTTDADTAKNLHYSLLPQERLFVVPPPPPPIVLVAAQGQASTEERAGSTVRGRPAAVR